MITGEAAPSTAVMSLKTEMALALALATFKS